MTCTKDFDKSICKRNLFVNTRTTNNTKRSFVLFLCCGIFPIVSEQTTLPHVLTMCFPTTDLFDGC